MLIGSLIPSSTARRRITIIAMGMTLVIALGGTDISVGALVAVSGALALKFLRWDIDVYTTPGDYTVQPFRLGHCGADGRLSADGSVQRRSGGETEHPADHRHADPHGGGPRHRPDRHRRQAVHHRLHAVPAHRRRQFPGTADAGIISILVVLFVALFTRKTAFGMFVESRGRQPQRQPRFPACARTASSSSSTCSPVFWRASRA